ncbi:protein-L-isoaspartate O-methyltransferase family protein [Wenzhouxiangella marina]|uniref:Protein-L-isoaspartate O-methyltransferase n=1 Tax=Wenzhouxiangella marina TaxID=1579979 RepID=A0A0K0XTN9_9GAMM|nr:protein-L-isoaspartate O-methyltransferase [Wenzhouxiangella marina]AKS41025.1 Protein-L-isoaspartate O-methyltransferase [Wenzhouxiangella marina]MBB6087903.1 protein-L-isoaspartate(D-aspartate) O-methyltransferase [Wenzhouxiangella marina]
MSLNLDQARFNMVEQQVRTWEVLDPRVLDVLRDVPREDFVPSRYRKLAFADLRIPLAQGQVMMKPLEEGRVLQALAIEPGQRVLEIGTGSGFLAVCLAALGADVVTVDIHAELADSAQSRLSRLGIEGVTVHTGDALGEFSPEGQFDAVVVTASAAEVPDRFKAWVRPQGRLVAVRGMSPAMETVCLVHTDGDRWRADSLFETDLPRLIGAEDRPHFDF